MSALLLLAATAAGFADLDAIDRQVAAFSGGEAAAVDRRLRLQPCGSGLALSWRTSAQDSVVVQCGDAGGWRLFVPARSAGPTSPPAVTRGDAVAIAISGDGFTVSQPGEALEAGAVGAWIRVRPVSAGTPREVMRARIERPGLVTVPLP